MCSHLYYSTIFYFINKKEKKGEERRGEERRRESGRRGSKTANGCKGTQNSNFDRHVKGACFCRHSRNWTLFRMVGCREGCGTFASLVAYLHSYKSLWDMENVSTLILISELD